MGWDTLTGSFSIDGYISAGINHLKTKSAGGGEISSDSSAFHTALQCQMWIHTGNSRQVESLPSDPSWWMSWKNLLILRGLMGLPSLIYVNHLITKFKSRLYAVRVMQNIERMSAGIRRNLILLKLVVWTLWWIKYIQLNSFDHKWRALGSYSKVTLRQERALPFHLTFHSNQGLNGYECFMLFFIL